MSDTYDSEETARRLVPLLRAAIDHEHSFPEFLAQVLATAVVDHPDGHHAITAGRPGSWEASFVRQLVEGTVGDDDEYLPDYRAFPGGPDDLRRGEVE